jgi:hypothetical protein
MIYDNKKIKIKIILLFTNLDKYILIDIFKIIQKDFIIL